MYCNLSLFIFIENELKYNESFNYYNYKKSFLLLNSF